MNIRYSVIVPVDLMPFLNEKIKVVVRDSATRQMAFEDLVQRYLLYKEKDDDMAINLQQLSEAWKWSRPKTSRFLQKLQKFNIVSIDTVIKNKVVRLTPECILSSQITGLEGDESLQSISSQTTASLRSQRLVLV